MNDDASRSVATRRDARQVSLRFGVNYRKIARAILLQRGDSNRKVYSTRSDLVRAGQSPSKPDHVRGSIDFARSVIDISFAVSGTSRACVGVCRGSAPVSGVKCDAIFQDVIARRSFFAAEERVNTEGDRHNLPPEKDAKDERRLYKVAVTSMHICARIFAWAWDLLVGSAAYPMQQVNLY